MFNILTTPSIFQMDRKDSWEREEERRRRERERRRSIRDQDRSDLLSEHRKVVITQRVEGSGSVLGSGEVPARGRYEPTMSAPIRNLGITRTIVGLGGSIGGEWRGPYPGPSRLVRVYQEQRKKGCGIGGEWRGPYPGPSRLVRAHQERRKKGCGIGGKWRGPYPGPSQFVCAHQERRKGCGIGGEWRGPYPDVATKSEHQSRRGLVERDQQTLPRTVRRRGAKDARIYSFSCPHCPESGSIPNLRRHIDNHHVPWYVMPHLACFSCRVAHSTAQKCESLHQQRTCLLMHHDVTGVWVDYLRKALWVLARHFGSPSLEGLLRIVVDRHLYSQYEQPIGSRHQLMMRM